jgi:hypothetical protein
VGYFCVGYKAKEIDRCSFVCGWAAIIGRYSSIQISLDPAPTATCMVNPTYRSGNFKQWMVVVVTQRLEPRDVSSTLPFAQRYRHADFVQSKYPGSEIDGSRCLQYTDMDGWMIKNKQTNKQTCCMLHACNNYMLIRYLKECYANSYSRYD